MKVGLFFELQLPRPWYEGAEERLYRDSLEQAELADKLKFYCAWAQEHHFLEEYSHSTAPEVFLAAVSQRTKNLRLGHGVTLMPPNYNHPVRVAERIAALDLVSGGRVEWGTGESSSRLELEGFGIDALSKRAMWAECLREAAKMMCSEPYPGFQGEYFSMPPRNVVPKPLQKPHPPLWVACTTRETMRLAARLGLGALTFAFMDASEAKFWVDEYYEVFNTECQPIGRTVNPNIAMLMGLMCHRDATKAVQLGVEGQQFFAWALGHYYRHGDHTPGRTNLWERFKQQDREPIAGLGGIGTPDAVRENFENFERAGVDQLIVLHQAGGYKHEAICESLQLFGTKVLSDFRARDEKHSQDKQERLGPSIERALARLDPLPRDSEVPVVESYPRLWERQGAHAGGLLPKRSLEASAMWKLHVGGNSSTKPTTSQEKTSGND